MTATFGGLLFKGVFLPQKSDLAPHLETQRASPFKGTRLFIYSVEVRLICMGRTYAVISP